jgi:hypothetical protein
MKYLSFPRVRRRAALEDALTFEMISSLVMSFRHSDFLRIPGSDLQV